MKPSRPWLSSRSAPSACSASTELPACAAIDATERCVRRLHTRSSPSAAAEKSSGCPAPSDWPKCAAVTSAAWPRSTQCGGGGCAAIRRALRKLRVDVGAKAD
eukprot:scaffold17369_cov70-Phaeocystis_antarctica.AAC.2